MRGVWLAGAAAAVAAPLRGSAGRRAGLRDVTSTRRMRPTIERHVPLAAGRIVRPQEARVATFSSIPPNRDRRARSISIVTKDASRRAELEHTRVAELAAQVQRPL